MSVVQVNDVCLSNIESIYQLGERTRKKLIPGQSISSKIKELLIVCKVSGGLLLFNPLNELVCRICDILGLALRKVIKTVVNQ